MSVRDHYEGLLAEVYTWSIGDFDEAVERETARLHRAGVTPSRGGTALDLGAGSGVSAIALARLGYRVDAVDLSPTLLAELARRRGDLPVRCIEADLTQLGDAVPFDAEVAVAMGDTLPHLASEDDVREALRAVHERLRPDGRFVASFRDLSAELKGPERVIPVRAEADRILTCFLEPRADRVTVTDILHERVAGTWRMRASTYQKLRLTPRWLEGALREAGFRRARVALDVRLLLATAER